MALALRNRSSVSVVVIAAALWYPLDTQQAAPSEALDDDTSCDGKRGLTHLRTWARYEPFGSPVASHDLDYSEFRSSDANKAEARASEAECVDSLRVTERHTLPRYFRRVSLRIPTSDDAEIVMLQQGISLAGLIRQGHFYHCALGSFVHDFWDHGAALCRVQVASKSSILNAQLSYFGYTGQWPGWVWYRSADGEFKVAFSISPNDSAGGHVTYKCTQPVSRHTIWVFHQGSPVLKCHATRECIH